jgi:hypothetical protein
VERRASNTSIPFLSSFPTRAAVSLPMDKLIDGQFQRVEKALSTLITSIATYNPNPQLATDLAAADQELSRGLQQRMSPPFISKKLLISSLNEFY